MRKKIALIGTVIFFAVFIDSAWRIIQSSAAEYWGYSEERIYDPFVLDCWVRGLIDGILGATVCFSVSKKMKLKAWRFGVCGFVWWPLTISILSVYRFVKTEDKQNRYNYYALSLGLTFLVIYFFGTFLCWFANTIGAVSWQ